MKIFLNWCPYLMIWGECDQALMVRFPRDFLEEKVILIRKDYPELEGVKSKIIRIAIMQRLLRS